MASEPVPEMAAQAVPVPSVPASPTGATCRLAAIDTTCQLTVAAGTLVEPPIKGHEWMNFPTLAFLITHPSGRRVLFDLGCRKDFWRLPAPVARTLDAHVPGIRVDESLADVLVAGGIELETIEAAVISHHHYDHFGDPTTFPHAMALIVGPGFSEAFLPGYPSAPASPAHEEAFHGRTVLELGFGPQSPRVAGYPAHDYFGDGSLFVLDTPGHAVGHISALVRTEAGVDGDSFVFLGGDICHFGGSFRPTPYLPLPAALSATQAGLRDADGTRLLPVSTFTCCHRHHDDQDHGDARARTHPYYQVCSHAGSWYIDPVAAQASVDRLQALDADPRFLIAIAHDPGLMDVISLFPDGELNGWRAAGWKEQTRWRWLDELPREGKAKQTLLVDGTYVDGERVKDFP